MTTYGDIYTKFLIEYDKANVTSSYPSLTVYEIATILDKAYLALIAQKLTGNNPRRLPFEADIKAIEDLRPLVNTRYELPESTEEGTPHVADNMKAFDLDNINREEYTVDPETGEEKLVNTKIYGWTATIGGIYTVVYTKSENPNIGDTAYTSKSIDYGYPIVSKNGTTIIAQGMPYTRNSAEDTYASTGYGPVSDLLYYVDSSIKTYVGGHNYTDHIKLINHYDANKFYLSSNNIPVVKTPVGYLEDHYLCVLIDPFKAYNDPTKTLTYDTINVTYIKRPLGFVTCDDKVRFNATEFELGDSMAEELINLAIVMALETVESPRLNTKVQTRALES